MSLELFDEMGSPEFWKEFSRRRHEKGRPARAFDPSCWDRAAEGYDELEKCPDYLRQVNTVMNTLLDKGALKSGEDLLDVACGTGTYSLRMARYVRQVTALDISPGMLAVLRHKQELQDIRNVKVVESDWHRFKVDKKFHLVFASMTPLLRDLENVDRMLELSGRFLALVTWAGVRENLLLDNLARQVLGHGLDQATAGRDIFIPFNYLYSLGYSPDVTFFNGCWDRRRLLEQQTENVIWRLEMFRNLSLEEKELVREELARRADSEGMVNAVTRVRTCLVVVDKEAARLSC